MATWDDVRRLALALPETSERASRENTHWWVRDKSFVWERPLGRSDLAALAELGQAAPEGPILAVRVADLGVRQALIAGSPEVYFSIPHLANFPAVLVLLDRIELPELGELIVEAWLLRAPKRLARSYTEP